MINNRQNGRRRGRGGVRPPNGANSLERGSRLDNRARGNASQLHEKYKTLARDAQMQGDRVMTEYYLQFADHYFRVLSESRARLDEQQQQQQQQRRERYDGPDADEDDGEGETGERAGEQPRAAQPRRGERAFEGERDPRRERQPRETRRDEEPAEARAPDAARDEAPADEAEATRRPRGRRPRVRKDDADETAPEERIEVDRLPPAFSAEPEAKANGAAPAADAAKPARRTRRTAPRPTADTVNVDA